MVKQDMVLIGDIAQACGISPDTVRYYERKGVIADVVRDTNGYRRYPRQAIDRVRIVRRAMSIGFSLDELSRIFKQRASGQAPCNGVRDLAVRKLAGIEEQIAALEAMRGVLTATIENWNEQLRASDGGLAHLLESLVRTETK